ncbi:signal peptidase II [bacterium]|nr:signal peptidase II [bacterium]
MKDKKALIFYFLMTIVLLDFGNHLKRIFENSYISNKISNSIFSILVVNNTGSAFGMFQDKTMILAWFGILVVLVIAFEVIKNISFNTDKTELLSLTFFSAGALGNALERINFGYVADYIKLNFIDFPVFNAFDIMICIGIFLYCLCLFFDFKKAKKVKNEGN